MPRGPRVRRRRGSGTIYKRGDKYVAELNAGTARVVGRRRISFSASSRAECEAWLRDQHLAARTATEQRTATTVSFGTFFDGWLEARTRLRPSTKAHYEATARLHITPYLSAWKLNDIDASVLTTWQRQLREGGASPRVLRAAFLLVAASLKGATKQRLIVRNPAGDVEAPVYRAERRKVLSEKEITALLKAARGTRLEAPIALAIGTGIRLGELLALRWSDFNAKAGTLRIERALTWPGSRAAVGPTKTPSAVRNVALGKDLAAILKRHQKEQLPTGRASEYMFATSTGTLYNKRNFSRAYQALREKAGIEARFHDLRHACASHALARGVDVATISARLGHANPAITLSVYSHAVGASDHTAAQVLGTLLRPLTKSPRPARRAQPQRRAINRP